MLRRDFMLIGTAAAVSCRSAQPAGGTGPAVPEGYARKVGNVTKVVRLIDVPKEVDVSDDIAAEGFATSQRATKTDVFLVQDKSGKRHPMSWLGTGAFVDHADAVKTDPETVVQISVRRREQVQWESEFEFTVSIAPKADVTGTIFKTDAGAPKDPFAERGPEKGGLGRPIRSGAASLNNGRQYNQLYKVTFAMKFDGVNEEIIDPDVYCEWG